MGLREIIARKAMPYVLAAGILTIAGCKEYRTELSDVMHDEAVVTKQYVPDDDQTGTGLALGVAMDNIPVGVALGSSMSSPAKYIVHLHGKKVSFQFDSKSMYDSVNERENVRVNYREVYRNAFEDLNKDGNKELVGRMLVDYKFVNAEKL
jgi:hypothetical protein